MNERLPACARCGLRPAERACLYKEGRGPNSCPTQKMKETLDEAMLRYRESTTFEFARQASIQEGEGYADREAIPFVLRPFKSRLEETHEFAARMGYRRLGLAFCVGLRSEAGALDKVLTARGFEVVSVICKAGCIPKEEIGLTDSQKINPGTFETVCNPVGQALVLNKVKTDFNILLGLCVGHDSLFFQHAQAPTTVFAVKDRVMGHNPMAALYTLGSYYRRLKK